MAVLGFVGAIALAGSAITKENTPPLSEWISCDGITGNWRGLRGKTLD